MRSHPPVPSEPVDIHIISGGSGLSSNAPMSEKDNDDESLMQTPRNRNVRPTEDRTRSNKINAQRPKGGNNYEGYAAKFFNIGTPPDALRQGVAPGQHVDKSVLPASTVSGPQSSGSGHQGDGPSAMEHLLISIRDEITGCKDEIGRCSAEVAGCKENIKECVHEVRSMKERFDAFEKKVEVSFDAVARTFERHEGKPKEIESWNDKMRLHIDEKLKTYEEKSKAILISASQLREQAETLENMKVQLLKFSDIGQLEAEIDKMKEEIEANSRSVIAMEGTLSNERSVRGNIESYVQRLVSQTEMKKFSDGVASHLTTQSKRYDELKQNVILLAKHMKLLKDSEDSKTVRETKEHVMKMALRLNELRFIIDEIRGEHQLRTSSSACAGISLAAGMGTWEKSGDTIPSSQGLPSGPPSFVPQRTMSPAPVPPATTPPCTPSVPNFGSPITAAAPTTRGAGSAPPPRERCPLERPRTSVSMQEM